MRNYDQLEPLVINSEATWPTDLNDPIDVCVSFRRVFVANQRSQYRGVFSRSNYRGGNNHRRAVSSSSTPDLHAVPSPPLSPTRLMKHRSAPDTLPLTASSAVAPALAARGGVAIFLALPPALAAAPRRGCVALPLPVPHPPALTVPDACASTQPGAPAMGNRLHQAPRGLHACLLTLRSGWFCCWNVPDTRRLAAVGRRLGPLGV